MSPLQLALWGLAGGFAVEGLELVSAIRRTRGWPWRFDGEVGLGPYLASVGVRLVISAVVAMALGWNGQVSGPAGALIIGITAPLIVEKTFRHVVPAPAAVTKAEQPTPVERDTGSGMPASARWETGDVG
jgi:hypothetical protein